MPGEHQTFRPRPIPTFAIFNPKVKLGLKNLVMLPSYFGYIFWHLRQKARLRPELSPKFLSSLGTNPARLTTLLGGTTFVGSLL